MGFTLKVRGSANVDPTPLGPERLRKPGLPLDIEAIYAETDGGVYTIGEDPVDLELGGETIIRFLSLRSVDPVHPILTVNIQTPANVAPQSFSLSDLVMLHNPIDGSEVTVLNVVGPGKIEVLVAGNPTA